MAVAGPLHDHHFLMASDKSQWESQQEIIDGDQVCGTLQLFSIYLMMATEIAGTTIVGWHGHMICLTIVLLSYTVPNPNYNW